MAGKYIELVGVAGAGKTATAKILVDEARWAGFEENDQMKSLQSLLQRAEFAFTSAR